MLSSREEAVCFLPCLMAFGRQELQAGQDVSKGGLWFLHRIDIFHHVCNFLFQLFFSEEKSLFFSRKFCLRILLLFQLFQGRMRFFESGNLDFSKERHGDSKPLSKRVVCGWLVMSFQSGWAREWWFWAVGLCGCFGWEGQRREKGRGYWRAFLLFLAVGMERMS